MSDALTLAERQLLEPGGLDQPALERVLNELMGPAVDAGDLYFQSTRFEYWVLEDGIVKEGSHSIEQGAGVDAIKSMVEQHSKAITLLKGAEIAAMFDEQVRPLLGDAVGTPTQ